MPIADLKYSKFKCKECGKYFSTNSALKIHHLKHQGVKFPCPKCDKVFTSPAYLYTHVKYVHSVTTLKPCPVCKKRVTDRNLSTHLKLHDTDREVFQCKQCDASFSAKSSLGEHLLRH